jgi:hypothetical protein
MTNFVNWYKFNKNSLKFLFVKLNIICNSYGINILNNKDAFNNFLMMMYQESNKEVINEELYPEFFNIKINLPGFQNYTILD